VDPRAGLDDVEDREDGGNMFARSSDGRLHVYTVPQPLRHNLNNHAIIDFSDIVHRVVVFYLK
jgi:hypothetical protein